MKKLVIMVVLASVIGTAAFAETPALKLSAGVGGLFGAGFGGGVEAKVKVLGATKYTFPTSGAGGFAFLDATFAELAIGFAGGGLTYKSEGPLGTTENKGSFTALDISLLGKYPFSAGRALRVFPLFGIDYRMILAAQRENGDNYDDPGDFSALQVRFGGGLDYSLNKSLYIRGELLYGIRFQSKYEADLKEKLSTPLTEVTAGLGHGPEVKIGIGYRF